MIAFVMLHLMIIYDQFMSSLRWQVSSMRIPPTVTKHENPSNMSHIINQISQTYIFTFNKKLLF